MDFIEKKIVAWEARIGQIGISGQANVAARELFKGYFGKIFKLKTFKGDFDEVNFNEKSMQSQLRLSCSRFFKKLKEGDIIYIRARDESTIEVTNKIPSNIESSFIQKMEPSLSENDLLKIIANLTKENHQLRETNSTLFPYKERIDKYESLQRIFSDEKFMEDWLERNIHKAVADLEIIDRQPTITWSKSGFKNRLDFFCLDKTTRELVIVENKVRGSHSTIETQYLSYSAWVSENLDKINRNYKEKNLKASREFKFVIITDTSDDRLESICRNSKITLVLIDGGVIFEEIVPYNQ